MGEVRPVSARKRKGPPLSSMSVPSRISAPIPTLAAFQRTVLADVNAFGELSPVAQFAFTGVRPAGTIKLRFCLVLMSC
jgi:hypothetical protein